MTARDRIIEIASQGVSSPERAELVTDEILAEHLLEIAKLLEVRYGITNRAASWLRSFTVLPVKEKKP